MRVVFPEYRKPVAGAQLVGVVATATFTTAPGWLRVGLLLIAVATAIALVLGRPAPVPRP